jgi:hypothetical protein
MPPDFKKQDLSPFVPVLPIVGSRIQENLRLLNAAANEYYEKNGTNTVTFDQLVGPGKAIPAIAPERDEDYRSILFMKGKPLRIHTKDGRTFSFPPP